MWQYNDIYNLRQDELMHYGVLGMRWGVRKARRKSIGKTLSDWKTKAQNKKIQKLKAKINAKKKEEEINDLKNQLKENQKKETKSSDKQPSEKTQTSKSVSSLSDAELAAAVKRLALEKQYRELSPKTVSKGQKAISAMSTVLKVAKTTNELYSALNTLNDNYKTVKKFMNNKTTSDFAESVTNNQSNINFAGFIPQQIGMNNQTKSKRKKKKR